MTSYASTIRKGVKWYRRVAFELLLDLNFWTRTINTSVDNIDCTDATEVLIVFTTSQEVKSLLASKKIRKNEAWCLIAERMEEKFGLRVCGKDRRERGAKVNQKHINISTTMKSYLKNMKTTGAGARKEPKRFPLWKEHLDKLFPNDPIIYWDRRHVDADEFDKFTLEELGEAVLSLAPGPKQGPWRGLHPC
ncbi:hypothetical protein M8J76_001488 [Diaphorina citri]|nr:hypothetical protein M8J76_001488 [Diaphorina citri]